MRKIKINGEFELILPEHRADRPEYHDAHGWEKARLQSMRENIGADDTVFYVGAEEGEMAALCAKWGAEVVLFEPNDKVWPNIKAIWDANELMPPLYNYVGFASDKTTEPIVVQGWPQCAYGEVIGNHGFKELSDPGDIAQIRLDDTPKLPTAISIDVEGSEWRVLKGAATLLEDYKPKIWLSGHPEFMFNHYREYLSDLRKWIKDFGYTEQLLAYDHEVHLFYEAIK